MGEAIATGVAGPSRDRGKKTAANVIDIHAHVLGPGDSGSGCLLSREFMLGPSFSSMLLGLGMAPPDATDARIRESLLSAIERSTCVDQVVVLALDAVHKNEAPVEAISHVIVPNDYVIGMARASRRVLFGASVHPYRARASMLAEAKRCLDEGAVLFTWSPAAQQIDPGDERCIPLYLFLAREGIPLLHHCGLDFSSREATHSECLNLRSLTRALDIGVKVIVSLGHCSAGGGSPFFTYDLFGGLLNMLEEADGKGWELYADISSLYTPSGVSCLQRIRSGVSQGKIRAARLLYGSDVPRPMIDINRLGDEVTAAGIRSQIVCGGNMLDNFYGIVREWGMEDSFFTSAASVLRLC